MNSKLLFFISLLALPFPLIAHNSDTPPELWSWFKDMNKSSAACKIQSSFILEKIGVQNIISNKHGVYGNYTNNRIVIKCLPKDNINENKKSILWVAVAGTDKDSVELLRNKIVKDIN